MGVAKVAENRRLLVFEDVNEMWTERRLTQEQAAELLGVSARTFRRIERGETDTLGAIHGESNELRVWGLVVVNGPPVSTG